MLFKDEFPPPRYTLDGDIVDSALPYTISHEFTSDVPLLTGHTLVLIAPRCAGILPLGAHFGSAEVRTTQQTTHEHTIDGFYEADTDGTDFKATHTSRLDFHEVEGTDSPVIAAELPALLEEDAAFAGKHLLDLKPQKIVLVTPGQSFMESPVCALCTSTESVPDVPPAVPPVIVQGVGAAAVSRAQQLNIPAIALVLSSDGPSNHEIVTVGSTERASRALDVLLGRAVRKVEKRVSELCV